MAHFYSNENFPLPVVEELRKLGHDVLTIQEIGRAGKALTDEEVFAFTCKENRNLLTLNRKHFIRLHQKNDEHPGLIVCTFDPDFVSLACRIHEAVKQTVQLDRQLIRINRPIR
jgi:predicted nuclease of predicted toxin-antitoxin system